MSQESGEVDIQDAPCDESELLEVALRAHGVDGDHLQQIVATYKLGLLHPEAARKSGKGQSSIDVAGSPD